MKTLYVTDLDGTLMRDDQTISDESVAIINRLLEKGICFTYATARSFPSASAITEKLLLTLPVILLNGTVITNPLTMKEIEIAVFGKEMQIIQQIAAETTIPFVVSAYQETKELKLYLPGRMNEGFQYYLETHVNDKRVRMVNTEEELYKGSTCYFTFIASKEELQPLYERLKNVNSINCVFQQDKYRPEYWLEIGPQNATKAYAIQRVQQLCGCEKVVVFGDSANDISMFRMADEAYAVKNAINELKKIATGIIEDNNADGVAKWLHYVSQT